MQLWLVPSSAISFKIKKISHINLRLNVTSFITIFVTSILMFMTNAVINVYDLQYSNMFQNLLSKMKDMITTYEDTYKT